MKRCYKVSKKISDSLIEYWLKWLNDTVLWYLSCTSYDVISYNLSIDYLTVYPIMANNSAKG